MNDKVLELNTYKNDDGLFIAMNNKRDRWASNISNMDYRFNGSLTKEDFKKTHHKSWYLLPEVNEIFKVEKLVRGLPINHRYELQDGCKVPEGVDLPKELSATEVGEEYDDDKYEYHWGNTESPWYGFRLFYERTYDLSPNTYEEIEFRVDHLGDITKKDAEHIKDTTYSVNASQWKSGGRKTLELKDIATYSELDEILYDEFLIHNRPCRISPSTSYKIIRHHVLDNLDPKECEVTSNYDFCFTVKKKIHIKPYIHKIEIKKKNGGSYAKPRFRTKNIEHKQVEIFNMAPKSYKGYDVISGFEANSLEELSKNIKYYLDDLMSVLNKPVTECEICGGYGCLIEKP